MATPYDSKIGAWFWTGATVTEKTIDDFLDMLEEKTPNVRAIFVKVSNGPHWQGTFDSTPSELTINGTRDIVRWVERCTPRGFDVHCWTVARGENVEEEIRIITSACQVDGVRSMILDVEVGDDYFIGGREDAAHIASQVRREIADDFHLSLCLDGRGQHPRSIFIDQWLPFVNSLQPMAYYDSFFPRLTEYDDVAKSSLEQIVQNLMRYDRPIFPIFPARTKVKDTMIDIAHTAIDRYNVSGYSLWRLGPSLYGKVTEQIRQLPVPEAIVEASDTYTNQQVIDAIARAAVHLDSEPKNWLRRADLEHVIDNRNGPYLGPEIMALPGLTLEQKELILLALRDEPFPARPEITPEEPVDADSSDRKTPPSNQDVINAFLAAADSLGDESRAWGWFRDAGLNPILTNRAGRHEPYMGLAIADLPGLDDEIKTLILSFLDKTVSAHLPEDIISPAEVAIKLRGVNIDLGNDLFSPTNLAPFTCCRFVFDMSMDQGSTDFDAAFAKYDPKLSSYIAAGITPILVLNHEFFGEGQNYNWDTMRDDSPETISRWQSLADDFVVHLRKLAVQYGDRVVYEIWNEPDQPSLAAVFVPEQAFAYLLDRSIETIHAVSPTAKVIAGGLVSGDAAYWHKTQNYMQYKRKLAGIGIHPYGQEDEGRSLITLLNGYAQGTDVRFWLTEWGVLGDPNKSEPPAVDEDVIADYAWRFIRVTQSDKRVAAIVWYGYADGMHNGYGLVRRNGSRKPLLWSNYTRGL